MFSFKKTVHGIDTFFFQPQGSEVVSLFRIIWGLVLALYFLTDFGNMADFYGPHAIISMNTVQNQFNFSHVSLFQMTGVTYSAVYFLLGSMLWPFWVLFWDFILEHRFFWFYFA